MSFHPLSTLLDRSALTWTESDVRWLVQLWLRKKLKTDRLYCDSVAEGRAQIRVTSAALKQEVLLEQPEVIQAVAEQTTYILQGLVVRISA